MKLKSYMAAATLGAGLLIANGADAQTNWVLGGNSPTATDTLGNKTNQDLKIITNKKVQMTIKKTGWVGIGTASPTARLDVWGGTAAKDTIPVINALVRYAGIATDARGIYADAATNTAPGYGYGVDAIGNWVGVSGSAAKFGVFGFGYGGDTTVAAGDDVYGVFGQSSTALYSIGVEGLAGAGQYNYGVYGETTGGIADTAGTKKWAGYFYGDLFAVRFFQASDNKLKKDIGQIETPLSKLSKIETATYNFRVKEFPGVPLPAGKQIGFLAENMETVFPELVKQSTAPRVVGADRKLVHDAFTFKSVNYEGMIPVIVAAVNEQSKIVDEKEAKMNARISQLENEIAQLKSMLIEKKGTVTETGSLLQNVPNPANGNTTISFYLPENSKGVLQIEDAAGKVVKSYKVTGSGMQDVLVNTATLSSGTYTYSLTINGTSADSKTMVITK